MSPASRTRRREWIRIRATCSSASADSARPIGAAGAVSAAAVAACSARDFCSVHDRVKRGETPCLGVCSGGPIVVVYPDGVWYGGVTPALLERIVVEHLRDGRVVEEAVFHRL